MDDGRLLYISFLGGLLVGLVISGVGALTLALGLTPSYGPVPGLFATAPLILGGSALLVTAVLRWPRRPPE